MSETASARWDPSITEAVWRGAPAAERRGDDPVGRLAEHVDALWGGPRPEPNLDAPATLLEAVWGPDAARAERNGDEAPEAPVQLSLFDDGAGPAAGIS
ncbi:MAG TPA: hypothetical protein VHL78_08505 [Actinomycetota bacterium]|nr:hypothetical protein [Actinomycetota bacterium]